MRGIINDNSKGFSLIEVLVVVAILGILAAITQLAVFSFGDEACDSTCAANMDYLAAEWFLENVLIVASADADHGHGNEEDNFDEDNPANEQRHFHDVIRTSQ